MRSGASGDSAYYVVLAGVLMLLFLLCCYFIYFCLHKISEFGHAESSARSGAGV